MSTNRSVITGIPVARFSNLVVTEATDEVLVYDTVEHHIHKLNVTTAAVWRLCDGDHDVNDIARLVSRELGALVDVAMVRLALTKLDEVGLLEGSLDDSLRVSRMTRRTLLQRSAVAGAIAVPAIVSVTAPVAAAASAHCQAPCPDAAFCQNLQGCTLCASATGGTAVCSVPAPGVCGYCTKNGDCNGYLYDSTTQVKCNNCYCWNGSAWTHVGSPLSTQRGVCWRNNTDPPFGPDGSNNNCGAAAAAAFSGAVETVETGTLTVTLVDGSGTGVTGSTFQLIGAETYTAAEQGGGSVGFTDVAPGSYTLHLLAAPGGASAPDQAVEIAAGDNYASVTLSGAAPEVTEAPATEPPVTEVPATEPPVNEVPATEPPVIEVPASDPPVEDVPPTDPPVVDGAASDPVGTPDGGGD